MVVDFTPGIPSFARFVVKLRNYCLNLEQPNAFNRRTQFQYPAHRYP